MKYLKSYKGEVQLEKQEGENARNLRGIKMNILMTLANPFTHDSRVYNEAKSLIKAGHKVTVLAWDKKRTHSAIELKDGINIVRSYNSNFMNILPYDIFRLHFWWRKGFRDALKLFKDEAFDVVHSHDLSSLPIGVKLKKKLGLPLIYDAHEIWGYMVASDFPWQLWKYYLWKENKLLKFIDYMIVTNEARMKFYKDKNVENIMIVGNCKHLISKNYVNPDNKVFTLLYIGILSPKRFLLELVDAVKNLDDVRCIIGGVGKPEYVGKLKQKCNESDNVKFIGKVPFTEVIPMTKKSDAVFCMIAPWDKNDITASTNKEFEAMASGRPIICTKGTFSGEFTEKYNIGLTSKYDKNDLQDIILKLKNNPNLREKLGKNALKLAIKQFNWKKQEEKLIGVYENLFL